MKLKQATEICKNINAENILTEDKIEAIQTLLNSQNPTYRLTKLDMLRIIEFLMQRNTPLKPRTIDSPADCCEVCPSCNERIDVFLDHYFCQRCGQALDWREKNDSHNV